MFPKAEMGVNGCFIGLHLASQETQPGAKRTISLLISQQILCIDVKDREINFIGCAGET